MKLFLVAISLALVVLTGCKGPADYHDGSSIAWIEQQVQNGTLTRAEADALLKQEENNSPKWK